MTRFLSAILALSALALSLVLVEESGSSYALSSTEAKPAGGPEAAVKTQTPLASDFHLPAQAVFADFVDRPLFSMSRRPFEPPVETVDDLQPVAFRPGAQHQKPRMSLTAVVINGEDRFVLLSEQGSGANLVVRTGGTVSGWSLEEIRPDGVTLRQGEGTEEIPLRTFEAPPPPQQRKAKRKVKQKSTNTVVAKVTKVERKSE